MDILLTGGNGVLGRDLLPYLTDAGHSVAAVVRSSTPECAGNATRKGVSWITGNLADPKIGCLLPKSIDAIVHFASRPIASLDQYDRLIYDNILATWHLIRYAIDCGVKKFIYASTISVHGTVLTERLDEKTPIINPCLYGLTKHGGEKFLSSVASQLPSIALRLPGVLGPNSHSRIWPRRVLSDALSNVDISIYNPDTLFNIAIHIDDLGPFIVQLLQKEWQGAHAIPLGAESDLSVKETVEYIIKKTGSQSKIIVKDNKQKSFWIARTLASDIFGFRSMPMKVMLDRMIEEIVH
ncbi:MAG: NAD(P)-dependent oxidoreductase [Nitrospirae bacterium]|nr:NAD(P)-dependent oxidoreductase [Magnetococcales bacterium]HAT51328.1 hypothetical protein [Alphaproteobacteria bacterium]